MRTARRTLHGLAGIGLCLLACGTPAAHADDGSFLSLVVENDAIYDTDRHYTSGVAMHWLSPADTVPGWTQPLLRWLPFPEAARLRHGYGLGQNMYTPRDTALKYPPDNQRPYAGWLYGSLGLVAESDDRLDQFVLTLGMVGPASGARQTQNLIHRLIDADLARGWSTQLGNEPGIILSYQRSWHQRLIRDAVRNLDLEVIPHAGAAVGNIHTHANAGATLRFGKNLQRDYGPPRIQPSLPGSGHFQAGRHFSWYAFAGVEGRLVARNIFLDGNSFKNSRHVRKEPLVGDLQFGLALIWPGLRLTYTHVLRSQEFREQRKADNYGSFTLSMPL